MNETSGLADELPEQEGEVVALIEGLTLTALTPKEAYYLGQLIQAYGPQRVKWAIDKKRHSNQPLRAAYAMLKNGAFGKGARQKDPKIEEVKYFTPNEEYKPFG